MKLINVLKNTILFESGRKKESGKLIFSELIDNKLIQLKSTYHQRVERFGNLSYDEIVELYKEYIETRRSKFQAQPRLAVPDSMVRNTFRSELNKVYESFNKINPENNKLIFIKKRDDNEDDKNFDYMEFLISKDGNFFNIITSAFSENGNFLKTKDQNKSAKRVTLEQFNTLNIQVVYL
jgi:hypothetical protein